MSIKHPRLEYSTPDRLQTIEKIRDFDAEWLQERIHELGWNINREFFSDKKKRYALLSLASNVATRCPTNDDFRRQSEAMLRELIQPDLETRILLINEDEIGTRFQSPDSGEATHQVARDDIVRELLNTKVVYSDSHIVVEGTVDHAHHYLFPLIGKRSIREIIKFPKNADLVMGALYVGVNRSISAGQEDFLCRYATDIGPKVHLKYHRQVMDELYGFRDVMLSEASHNLGAPINALASKLRLIQKGLHGEVPDDLVMPLEHVTKLSLHAEITLRKYIESAKKGKMVYRPEMTDLKNDIVDILLDRYSDKLKEKGAKFKERYDTSFSRDTVTFECHPIWLHDAIEQLIKNIIDHAPQGCRFAIGYDQRDDYHRLHVWSSGEHIQPEKLESRESPLKSDHSYGYGIGLQSVRRIVEELHRGKFEIEHTLSPEEGPGNDMILYIPKEQATPAK
jgi:signal transduction histidine kinase